MKRLATICLREMKTTTALKDGTVKHHTQFRFTISKEIMNALDAKAGDFMDFIKQDDGTITVVIIKG